MISGQLCGLESTRVEGSPAPSLLPTGDAGARGEECQLGVERERVNPGGGTPRARRWQGQLSGHKRQDKRGVEDFLPRDTGPSVRVSVRLGSVKKSQQTKSNPLPPAIHVTIIMIINIDSAENIIDDLECDELKAPRRVCFKNRNEIENSCLPILDLGAEAQRVAETQRRDSKSLQSESPLFGSVGILIGFDCLTVGI